MLSEAQGVSLRIISGMRVNPTQGCWASMADSHTGNHPKDGFMLLKTIRSCLASWEFGQNNGLRSLWAAKMAFRNFIYTKDDDDNAFLPKEPSLGFGTGSLLLSDITTLCIEMRRLKKLASGSSSSHVVRAKTSASKDDAPILSIFDDDEGKFPVHLVLFKGIDLLIHHLSSLYVIEKMSGEADVIKTMERSREEECKELRVKCEAAMAEFDQNPVVLVLRDKISSPTAHVKEHKEVEELKQDRRDVVSKVIPYAAMKLVHSDELGRLVGTLVSSAITYGRCRAYEQVAAIKDPFDLSKAKGYRSSYKKEHTQKATPSSAPSSNLMSPLANLVKPSPSPFE
ncbi:hypothetical protein Tco_0298477 [Tanacetum coccineum]